MEHEAWAVNLQRVAGRLATSLGHMNKRELCLRQPALSHIRAHGSVPRAGDKRSPEPGRIAEILPPWAVSEGIPDSTAPSHRLPTRQHSSEGGIIYAFRRKFLCPLFCGVRNVCLEPI